MSVSSKMTAIADAIRNKTGRTDTLTLDEMATAINGISTDSLDTSDATATASDILSGETAYVNGEKITGTIATKTSSNVTVSGRTVTIPAGYYASKVTKSIGTTNRASTTITTTADDTNDKLTITASNNQSTGYVTGSNQTATTTISLTASGNTVTASDGTNSIRKAISSGSAKTPATTISANPTISIDSSGKITASTSTSKSITPTVTAGYVSGGTAGTVTVSGSNTKQLTTQAAKTVTPSTSSQTAVASGVYTTGTITVAAIPSQYISTTDATATAADILSGKTAYVNGSKITGTHTDTPQTCTVTINAIGKLVTVACYQQYINGAYEYSYDFSGSKRTEVITLTNVVVNSPIVLSFVASDILSRDTTGSVVYKTYNPVDYKYYNFVYTATSTSGGTITLS